MSQAVMQFASASMHIPIFRVETVLLYLFASSQIWQNVSNLMMFEIEFCPKFDNQVKGDSGKSEQITERRLLTMLPIRKHKKNNK